DLCRIEGDADHLRVSGRARGHLPVRGVGHVPARVPRFHLLHAPERLEDGLEAPEAAAPQGGLLEIRVVAHDFFASYELCSRPGVCALWRRAAPGRVLPDGRRVRAGAPGRRHGRSSWMPAARGRLPPSEAPPTSAARTATAEPAAARTGPAGSPG